MYDKKSLFSKHNKKIDKYNKNQKAIALSYQENSDAPPKVIASGKGEIAQKILDIAHDNNIAIRNDSDLADILSVLEIGEYIPVEIYGAIAKILSEIHRIDKNKK